MEFIEWSSKARKIDLSISFKSAHNRAFKAKKEDGTYLWATLSAKSIVMTSGIHLTLIFFFYWRSLNINC